MIILNLNEELKNISLTEVIKYNNHFKNLDNTFFNFSELENGKHLINIKLLKNRRNIIIELEKWSSSRITISHDNEIEVMGKMNNGNWRKMKDMYGIKDTFKEKKGLK